MSHHHHPRRILTPGALRKRKEREIFYSLKLSASAQAAANSTDSEAVSPEPKCSNRLLAGYMAYEFLTRGTLFGQKFDPARTEAVSLESKRLKPEVPEQQQQQQATVVKEHKSFAEVATILKTDGAHIPGIVNPTQLTRWIQMWRVWSYVVKFYWPENLVSTCVHEYPSLWLFVYGGGEWVCLVEQAKFMELESFSLWLVIWIFYVLDFDMLNLS